MRSCSSTQLDAQKPANTAATASRRPAVRTRRRAVESPPPPRGLLFVERPEEAAFRRAVFRLPEPRVPPPFPLPADPLPAK
jgi:hypothetical protein